MTPPGRPTPRRSRATRAAAAAAAAGLLVAASACGQTWQEGTAQRAVLDPRGPAARDIAVLWWGLLAAGTVVLLVTMAMLALAVRGRGRSPSRQGPGTRFVLLWGFALPVAVLLSLLGATVATGARVYTPPEPAALSVEVVGHQFWWEVHYDDGTVTANELHIPAGVPVELTLRSADVIHTFWVPQLHGKMDMIPGRANRFWIQADEPGVYEGVCAEYCGIQHAKMRKLVVAQPPAEFQAWLEGQAADAPEPTDPLAAAGREVFLGSSCVQCHAVRGTTPALREPQDDAAVAVGPDLTHLASRRTIAAGILPNQRGWLGGWILDPQAHKPGARMPPSDLEGEELQALLAYLETLR